MFQIKNIIFLLLLLSMSSCGVYREHFGTKEQGNKDLATVENDIDFIVEDTMLVKDVLIVEEGFSSDKIIDSIIVHEMVDVDSLEIIRQFLGDTTSFAKVFNNKYTSNTQIHSDDRMLTGSQLVDQLEELMKVKYLNKYEFVTDRNELNKLGFEPKERPTYSDSIYELRIEMLDMMSPMELVYNEHVKAYIGVYTRGRNQTSRMLGLKEIYFPIFEQALDKYDMPMELKYLAVIESALNPTAGSWAGAKGLWQFMYATGKRYGLTSNSMVDDRFDPYKSTDAAVRHLKDLYEIYHSWELALAAYNSGPGNVNRAIRRAGGVKDYWAIWPFLPRETRGYVPAFIAVNYVFNYAAEHNIFPTHPGIINQEIDSVTVHDVLAFDQIVEYLHIDLEDVEFLNPTFKQGIIPASSKKSYILRLPRKKALEFLKYEHSIYQFKSSKGIEREKLLVQVKKATERTIHYVRSGETLGHIARQYRTSVRNVKSWNGMRNSRIYPGQKLTIFPSGKVKTRKKKKRKKNGNTQFHIVKSGETPGHIAERYNISVRQLKRWNNLRGHMINIGQKLIVSDTNSNNVKSSNTALKGNKRYHTIRQGDTLWDLSRRYGVSVSDIKKWNSINNSYRLKLDDRLIIGKKI